MKKILVINNIKISREYLINVLSDKGFISKGAENGAAGLELAKTYLPDLIISVLKLPDMSGYSFFEKIRKDKHTMSIPLIFILCKPNKKSIEKIKTLGIDGYIIEPFIPESLIDTILSVFKKYSKLKNQHKKKIEGITKKRLEHLLSTSPAVIYSFSDPKRNTFSYISKNVNTLLGYTPGDFIKTPEFWINHIHPIDAEKISSELSCIYYHGYFSHEYRLMHRDGNYRWIYDEQKLILDSSGKPKEVVGSWLDITKRKRTEEELEQHRNHLEELVEIRTGELKQANKDLLEENIQRKKAEESLKYKLTIEKVVSHISTNFINTAPDEVESEINRVLNHIGKLAGVDRCHITLILDNEKQIGYRYEWCAEGLKSRAGKVAGISIDPYIWLMENSAISDYIEIPSVAGILPEIKERKKFFQLENIRSFLTIPIFFRNSSILGFIGFDMEREEKIYKKEEIHLLKITGEIIINVLERNRIYDFYKSCSS